MKPPYTITSNILNLVSEISQKIGEINATLLVRQSPELRKRNRIRTIQASLAVEGNTLSIDLVTAIIDKKRVLGPEKDIREVANAIQVYEQIRTYKPYHEKSFLAAHKSLMKDLIPAAGKYRTSNVGIVKGSELSHLAPHASNVPFLMKNLFSYLKQSEHLALIKSAVAHYEIEFIHPFMDGNGRMGRLWQTLILMQDYPVFEFLPFETLISRNQKAYYKALSDSDKKGESTLFIEFMLKMINASLDELLLERVGPVTQSDRIRAYFSTGVREFTRKMYMSYFKTISTATASRDLQQAVKEKLLIKEGDKSKTVYRRY